MAILATFTKQPQEVLDYDVDYSEWFAPRADLPDSHTVIVPAGITYHNSSLVDKIVQVMLGGGTDQEDYKITVRLTTTTGRVREADFLIKVRET